MVLKPDRPKYQPKIANNNNNNKIENDSSKTFVFLKKTLKNAPKFQNSFSNICNELIDLPPFGGIHAPAQTKPSSIQSSPQPTATTNTNQSASIAPKNSLSTSGGASDDANEALNRLSVGDKALIHRISSAAAAAR